MTLTSDSGNTRRVNQAQTATYTPDASITGSNGRNITGTATVTGTNF